MIEPDDDNMVHLEKKKVQECVKRIYDNRISFAYIAIGYVLSVFGESPNSNKVELMIYMMFYMIFSTISLILVEKIIPSIFARLLYHTDIEMNYSEIEDIADAVATDKEIDEIIDGIENVNQVRVCNIHWLTLLSFVWRVSPSEVEGRRLWQSLQAAHAIAHNQ